MRRIRVIVPFPMSDENRELRRSQLGSLRFGPDTVFEFESVRAAPRNYVSAADMALAEFGIMEAGLSAQSDGFDAVCIDTMSDSGVSALRSSLDIPVFGPGRASMLAALMLGDRFSILAMWPQWTHLYTRVLRDLRLSDHCASVRSLDVTPNNQSLLSGKEDEILPKLREIGMRAIEEDGADVLILGSTTMHQAHAYLTEHLPVPVINPGPLCFKMAETMLDLGLGQSRRAYPKSPRPKDAMIKAMLDAAATFPHD